MNTTNTPSASDRVICLRYLGLAAEDLFAARRTRDRYIKLGRQYGLTNQEIGEALGITEARVRAICAVD